MNAATLLANATDAAHAAAANFLAPSQIKPGEKIPTTVSVKESGPADTLTLDGLTGINIIVRFQLICADEAFL